MVGANTESTLHLGNGYHRWTTTSGRTERDERAVQRKLEIVKRKDSKNV